MKINSMLVKKLRADKQWSQAHLSQACGLNLRTIQRLENNSKASMESVKALAAVFDIDSKQLILRTNDNPHTPPEIVKSAFVNYADFSGTSTRSEYWWFLLFVSIMAAIASIVSNAVLQIFALIVLLPLVAAGTRRLNETGQSGWWQLLAFVPFGIFVVFYLLAMECKVKSEQSNSEVIDIA